MFSKLNYFFVLFSFNFNFNRVKHKKKKILVSNYEASTAVYNRKHI